LTVICELLGVAGDLRDELHHRSVQLICTDTPPGELLDIEQATYALLSEIAADKRRSPADLTTALIEAQDENGSLTPQELAGTLLLLIVPGHETTSSLITDAARALLSHPQEAEMALSGARPWVAVIEETLRWDAPVGHMPMRYAPEDMEFHGQLICKGDAIMVGYSTAGRDPAQFGADAGRFCPARYDPASRNPASKPAPRHLSCSQGPHFCLGASLARLEAGVALPALFTRFPDMSLACPVEDLKPVESVITNTAAKLPVVLSA
jgi:cytochrome P450